MSYYPRSFLNLLLIGFTLVALPLIAALATSAIAVDRLSTLSSSAVYQAAQATQNSRRLMELMTLMERSARQLVILGDRSVLDAYKIGRAEFQRVASQFASLPFDAEQRANLDAIVREEQEIYDVLSAPSPEPRALESQVVRFVDLSGRAQSIMTKSNQLIDREVETMRQTADRAQRIMLWQAFALVPVVIFLVGGFTVLISRPIRQLDAAIRELGSGQFHVPVVVGGPQDLEYLGGRLEWMRRQLLDMEQQKNRFLQQIAHDLKTPLTALREGTQLLADNVVGSITPEQREIVDILRHNSLELQRRIEELLDYGAIQFHKMSLDTTQVDARKVLEQVAQGQKLALQAKNLTLDIAGGNGSLAADEAKLRVVLDNLLSNAIRFSPEGATIVMSMKHDHNQFVIDVIDRGPGIADADRPYIFEPYYQGRHQGQGAVRGSGLGLSIVKNYVLAHGGSVEVAAARDHAGAHFVVRLPLTPVPVLMA